jgi:hypothetical protein
MEVHLATAETLVTAVLTAVGGTAAPLEVSLGVAVRFDANNDDHDDKNNNAILTGKKGGLTLCLAASCVCSAPPVPVYTHGPSCQTHPVHCTVSRGRRAPSAHGMPCGAGGVVRTRLAQQTTSHPEPGLDPTQAAFYTQPTPMHTALRAAASAADEGCGTGCCARTRHLRLHQFELVAEAAAQLRPVFDGALLDLLSRRLSAQDG